VAACKLALRRAGIDRGEQIRIVSGCHLRDRVHTVTLASSIIVPSKLSRNRGGHDRRCGRVYVCPWPLTTPLTPDAHTAHPALSTRARPRPGKARCRHSSAANAVREQDQTVNYGSNTGREAIRYFVAWHRNRTRDCRAWPRWTACTALVHTATRVHRQHLDWAKASQGAWLRDMLGRRGLSCWLRRQAPWLALLLARSDSLSQARCADPECRLLRRPLKKPRGAVGRLSA